MLKCTGCKKPKSESEFYNYAHDHKCIKCMSDDRKAKYAKDPEGHAAKKREYTKRNPDAVRDTKLRQTYGIGLDDYNHMFTEQDGKCAVCKRPETAVWRGKTIRLAVDHKDMPDGSKHVRGLLCMKCNRAQGLLEESIDSTLALAEYIKKHLK